MNVKITITDSIACLIAQQIVIDKGLGCLARKFHHHTGWRVSIHVGIFTSYFIILCLNYFKKNITGLGSACN